MDPFSITVGTISLIEVCSRLVLYLRNVRKASITIGKDLQTLWDDVNRLIKTANLLKEIYEARPVAADKQDGKTIEADKLAAAWQNVCNILPQCEDAVQDLQSLLEEIDLPRRFISGTKLEGFVKQLKKSYREGQYASLRRSLSNYESTLKMLLSAIQM